VVVGVKARERNLRGKVKVGEEKKKKKRKKEICRLAMTITRAMLAMTCHTGSAQPSLAPGFSYPWILQYGNARSCRR